MNPRLNEISLPKVIQRSNLITTAPEVIKYLLKGPDDLYCNYSILPFVGLNQV